MNKPRFMQPAYENRYYQLSRLVDEIRDYAIILLDTEGVILNWNRGAQRIKGYRPDEIIGKNFRLFYTKEDLAAGKPCALLDAARENGVAYDEGWRVRGDGSSFWASITITAVHDDFGKVVGFGKVTRDQTDKRKAEEERLAYLKELEQKNKELEQFAYIAAHDLQEPLGAIRSFAALLFEEYKDRLDENGVTYLDFLSGASLRMQELIKGLLDYSSIGKGRQLSWVSLNQLVQEVIEERESCIKEKCASVAAADLPYMWGYREELRSLFRNLLDNSLKYSRRGIAPAIRISARQEEEACVFSVEDNGIGIAPKNKDRIFTLFKQLHNRGEYKGTGVGLSQCRKVVDLHGGAIWLDPVYCGGSRFQFRIPNL